VALILGSVAALLVAAPVLLIIWRLYLPVLDEHLGVFTRRDLRLFLTHSIGETTVGAVIEARAGAVTWRATHRDWLSETDLEGTTRDGTSSRWTVTHWPPRPWLPRLGVYITPTNRSAGALVPELIPRDVAVEALPIQAYRPGAIYDLAEPLKAREWLEPYLRRMVPDLFRKLDERVESRRGPTNSGASAAVTE
jgi:hypothetical protein